MYYQLGPQRAATMHPTIASGGENMLDGRSKGVKTRRRDGVPLESRFPESSSFSHLGGLKKVFMLFQPWAINYSDYY
jgi:hypothetical protein